MTDGVHWGRGDVDGGGRWPGVDGKPDRRVEDEPDHDRTDRGRRTDETGDDEAGREARDGSIGREFDRGRRGVDDDPFPQFQWPPPRDGDGRGDRGDAATRAGLPPEQQAAYRKAITEAAARNPTGRDVPREFQAIAREFNLPAGWVQQDLRAALGPVQGPPAQNPGVGQGTPPPLGGFGPVLGDALGPRVGYLGDGVDYAFRAVGDLGALNIRGALDNLGLTVDSVVRAVFGSDGSPLGVQLQDGRVVLGDGRVLAPTAEAGGFRNDGGVVQLYDTNGIALSGRAWNGGLPAIATSVGAGSQVGGGQASVVPPGSTTLSGQADSSASNTLSASTVGTSVSTSAAAGTPVGAQLAAGLAAGAGVVGRAGEGLGAGPAGRTPDGSGVVRPEGGAARGGAARGDVATAAARVAQQANVEPPLVDRVAARVEEFTGVKLASGALAELIQRFPRDVWSRFADNPLAALASPPSSGRQSAQLVAALIASTSGGQGVRGQMDVVVQMFDALVAKNPTPQQVYNFLRSLTPDQLAHLVAQRGDTLATLRGLPDTVRDQLGRRDLETSIRDLQQTKARESAQELRLAGLERLAEQNGYRLVHFRNAPLGYLPAGSAVAALGNLHEARYVAYALLGKGNSLDSYWSRIERLWALWEYSQTLTREEVALLIGQHRFDDGQVRQWGPAIGEFTKGAPRLDVAFAQALRNAEARRLVADIPAGLVLRDDSRVTVIGHSSGGLTVTRSLEYGLKVDAAVVMGVVPERLRQLRLPVGNGAVDILGYNVPGDYVDEGAVHGADPELEAPGQPGGAVDWLAPGHTGPASVTILPPHDAYLEEGSPDLGAVAGIVVNHRPPKLVTPEPEVITLARRADETGEGVWEPVA